METHRIHSFCNGALHKAGVSPVLVPGLPNCTTLYTVLRNGIRTGGDGTRRACSLGHPWNAPESSRRQTCKLSLALSQSTTCDGLRLASRTPKRHYGDVLPLLLLRSIFVRD